MSGNTSLLDLTAQAFGAADFFTLVANDTQGAAGQEFQNANTMLGLVDGMIATVDGIIGQLQDLAETSPVLGFAKGYSTTLTQFHAVAGALDKIKAYVARANAAANATDLAGQLNMLANTAQGASELLGAASVGLGVLALAMNPEVAALLGLVAATTGGLSTTLGLINTVAGSHSDLVTALNGGLTTAQNTGMPVTFDLPSAGGPSNLTSSGKPIKPIVITSDDGWETIRVDENQRGLLLIDDDIPPDNSEPGDDDRVDPEDLAERPETETPYTLPDDDIIDRLQDPNRGGGGGGGGGGVSRPRNNDPRRGPGGPSDGDKGLRDPLVLDLDGDGIELTDLNLPPVFFDADGDGLATMTGWVDPDDGLLARDVDGNGQIETQAELFGTNSVDALTDLATQDANGDGAIDASDPIWTNLRLWRDLDQNGQSSPAELQTMEEAGILRFSLTAQPVGQLDGDNLIFSTSTYETVAGRLGDTAAVFFGIDTLLNQTEQPEIFEAGSPFLGIPNVKGYGTLPDLRVAAFLDPALMTLIEDLIDDSETLTGEEFQIRFEALALKWAGVEDVDPGTDPTEVNAQHEAFLQAFRGQDRLTEFNARQVVSAEDSYFSVLNSLALRFAIGLPGLNVTSQSSDDVVDAVFTSPFYALAFLRADPQNGLITGNLDRVIYEIARALPDDMVAALAYLDKVLPVLSALRDEYFPESRGELSFVNEAFDAYMAEALSFHLEQPTLVAFAQTAINRAYGTTGTDQGGAQTLDLTTHGQAFSRSFAVDLGEGDDSLDVDQQTGFGDVGWSVTYVYRQGDGDDDIDVSGARGAHILFLPDIDAADLVIETAANGLDGIVRFADGASITFTGLFSATTPGSVRSLTIYTADGQTLSASGVATNGLFISTPADETLTGTASFPDVFVYGIGDGADTIAETFSAFDDAVDEVRFVGITPADLILTQDGDDLLITFANGAAGDSVRIQDQFAAAGFLSNDPGFRIETFRFPDGTLLTAAEVSNALLARRASDGDDTFSGFRYADILRLSDGSDALSGGNSGDIYRRAADVTGDTRIDDNGSVGTDQVILEGVTLAEAMLSIIGNDVQIDLPDGSVTLVNQVSAFGTLDRIEEIVFDDVTLSSADLAGLLFPLSDPFEDVTGTDMAETVEGENARNDRIDGLEADDTLTGRGGSDLYVISATSGSDTIEETGRAAHLDFDRVQFTDALPSDLALTRDGTDLIVDILPTGQTLTIVGQTLLSEGIEGFVFSDSSTWSPAEIAANTFLRGTDQGETLDGTNNDDQLLALEGNDEIFGGAGSDLYVLRPGDGNDLIADRQRTDEEVNTLRLLDTSLADIRVEIVSDGLFFRDLLLRYGVDDSVALGNANEPDDEAEKRPIQRVELMGDGTVLTSSELRALGRVFGTDGDDSLTGATRIDALAGNDEITARDIGTDFLWRVGSGNDLIDNLTREGGSGRVLFEAVARADVSLSRDGLDLVVTHIASQETVTLLNQFSPPESVDRKAGVSELVFTDETLSRDATANAALTPSTGGVDALVGGDDNEVFEGGPGADTKTGASGDDLYLWSEGDGDDTLIEQADEGFDILRLLDVEDLSGISFSRVGGISDDLRITILATDEKLTLPGQLDHEGIEEIQFANGTRLDMAGLGQTVPLIDTAGSDSLDGDDGRNILQGLLGDDLLNGRGGTDTYLWAPGDGNDTIEERDDPIGGNEEEDEVGGPLLAQSAGDTLRLLGVRSDQITLAQPEGTADLEITYTPSGETILVVGQFVAPLTGIERILLDDDTFDRADLGAALGGETFTGDGTPQTLEGGSRPDVFMLSAADETVVTGTGLGDRIVVAEGGGVDRIEGFARGVGGTVIELTDAPFADFPALLAAATDTPEGVRLDLGGGNALLLVGVLKSDLEAGNFGFKRAPLVGSDTSETVLGTPLDDEINLLEGDDSAEGGAGDDMIDGDLGRDVIFYTGQSTDYDIEVNGREVKVTDLNPIDGNEGSDTILNGELLSFLGDNVTVSIEPPANQAPVAAGDSGETRQGESVTFTASALLSNDSDPDDDMLTIQDVADVQGGSASLNMDGSVTFAPAPDFVGQAAFDYTVTDNAGGTATARVEVAVAEVVRGTSDRDVLVTGPGKSFVTLDGGPDTLRGPVGHFYEDVISGFERDDALVFLGADIARQAIAFTAGSGDLAVDEDGDGTSDGSFTLEGDFTGGDFMAVEEAGDTYISFDPFLPGLSEAVAVADDAINAITNQRFLTGDGTKDFRITMDADLSDAAFDNSLGVYEVTETGALVDARILVESVLTTPAATVEITDVAAGHRLGFFLVQDGADWAEGLTASDTLSFRQLNTVSPASIEDGFSLELMVNDAAADQTVFHSYASFLNRDAAPHVLSGVVEGGTGLKIAFEDLVSGDQDFQDVVFTVETFLA